MSSSKGGAVPWSEARGILVGSLALAFTAVGLYTAFPIFQASPHLYALVALLVFALGVFGSPYAYRRFKGLAEDAEGIAFGNVGALEEAIFKLEAERKELEQKFGSVMQEFRNEAAHVTVSIVQDEPVRGTPLVKAFWDYGFQVQMHTPAQSRLDFADALKRFLSEEPDVLLIGQVTPTVSEVLEKLATMRPEDRPVVIFTHAIAEDPDTLRIAFKDLLAGRPAEFRERFVWHISGAALFSPKPRHASRVRPT